jgi:hypothetical protein
MNKAAVLRMSLGMMVWAVAASADKGGSMLSVSLGQGTADRYSATTTAGRPGYGAVRRRAGPAREAARVDGGAVIGGLQWVPS